MDNKKEEIDAHIEKHLFAMSNINKIRQEIAEDLCPLRIGDEVAYKKGDRTHNGIIESIQYAVAEMEFIGPIKGNDVSWSVCGIKILKTTGKIGRIRFSIDGFDYHLIDGVWTLKDESLTELERMHLKFKI